MNDQLAERLCVALEAIALELAEQNAKGTRPTPGAVLPPPDLETTQPRAMAAPSGPFPPIGGGQPPAPWVCPVHHSWKMVPAGFSQRTGKAYDAFIACPASGCNEKPPRGFSQPAPDRAVPPSEGIQGRELP